MNLLTCLLLLPSQAKPANSPDFPDRIQNRVLAATVRITNSSQRREGTGVVVGQDASFVFILTAGHVVHKASRLEIDVFTRASYPRPDKSYRSFRVIASSGDIRDLALIRMATRDKMPAKLAICPVPEIPKVDGFPGLVSGCYRGKAPTCLVQKVRGKKKVGRKGESATAYFWQVDGTFLRGDRGDLLSIGKAALWESAAAPTPARDTFAMPWKSTAS